MIAKLDARGTYAIFASLGLAAFTFIATQVPETKGRSLEQIQSLLQGRKDAQE